MSYKTEFLGNISCKHEFRNFNISVVDYTQKVSEKWHFHEKIHISSIIKGGNLESRKAKDIEVSPGRILIYDRGEIHRNRFTAHPSQNLNIEFEDHFFSDGKLFSYLNTDEKTNIEFLKIYFELLLNDAYSKQNIEQIVNALFWNDRYDSNGPWIQKLIELLNDRWDEFPSLNNLSHELSVHPVTISKYFSKNTGITLSEYMRKLKVKKAINLLVNSSDSFVEIALSCGFSDQSHMTRLIKKHTGFTPGVIRSLQ